MKIINQETIVKFAHNKKQFILPKFFKDFKLVKINNDKAIIKCFENIEEEGEFEISKKFISEYECNFDYKVDQIYDLKVKGELYKIFLASNTSKLVAFNPLCNEDSKTVISSMFNVTDSIAGNICNNDFIYYIKDKLCNIEINNKIYSFKNIEYDNYIEDIYNKYNSIITAITKNKNKLDDLLSISKIDSIELITSLISKDRILNGMPIIKVNKWQEYEYYQFANDKNIEIALLPKDVKKNILGAFHIGNIDYGFDIEHKTVRICSNINKDSSFNKYYSGTLSKEYTIDDLNENKQKELLKELIKIIK